MSKVHHKHASHPHHAHHAAKSEPKPLNMTHALKDGKVTAGEAKRIAQTYKKDGSLEHRKQSLQRFYEAHQDAFVPAAQQRMMHLLHPPEPRTERPTATRSDNVTPLPKYKRAYGSLFVKGVSDRDLQQGQLGDCYFLSAVNSVAQRDPKAIENLFHENRDGTVTINFYGRTTPGGPLTRIPITVDRRLPADPSTGQVGYVQGRTPRELWPALLEKGYAQLITHYPFNNSNAQGRSGYDAIGNGGNTLDAFTALTGKTGSQTGYFGATADQVWNDLNAATAAGRPTTASSNDGSVDPGLVHNHAYSVYGTTVENGQRLVVLHNPWGYQEVGRDGKDDGTFKIPIEQFVKNFSWVQTLS